jgi:DNA-binding PadR family transcriptional regulator
MSPDLNNTSYVILGLLDIHPRSGYDIKSVADHSTRYFWAISYGQIYPELTRLASLGYAELESESTAGRARRVFRITPKGRAAVRDWLADPGDDSYELRDELFLKLFFAETRETKLDLVRRIRSRHQTTLAGLRGLEDHIKNLPHKVRGGREVLLGGLRLHQAYIDYCDELEAGLAKEKSPAHTS